MSRFLPLFCTLVALGAAPFSGFAAEPALTQEVHELRRDLQLQSKKLDALTQQIAELSRIIQARDAARPGTESASPAATATAPAPRPAPAPEPEIPRAEAVPPSIQHVVEKGETLTSIAKHYNIPLSDLQKLNKITNDRKLQIGQTLNVPSPKAPETPAEKKDNP